MDENVDRPGDVWEVALGSGHCNQVDVIPVLEWTQVSVALGVFVALCSIRRWVFWIFLVWSFAGHDDQDVCLYAFKLTFSWRY